MKKFIEDQGSFVRDLLSALIEDEMACLVMNVASLSINAIEVMGNILAETDSENHAAGSAESRISPVVSQDMFKTRIAVFFLILRQYK